VNAPDRGAGRLTPAGAKHRRDREPLLLEFVGLPGAGKTAVAARVVAELRARGITCAERRGRRHGKGGKGRRLVQRATSLVRHYELTLSSLRFAAGVRPLRLTPVSRAFRVAGWARQLHAYAASDVEAVVLDQGPLQDLWSLTVPGRSWNEGAARAAVRHLMQVTRMPRVLVYVHVDVETAAERLRGRGGTSSRFDRLTAIQTWTWLTQYEQSLSSIFRSAVTISNAASVRVDGRRAIDDVAQEVIRFLDGARGDSAGWIPSSTVTTGALS